MISLYTIENGQFRQTILTPHNYGTVIPGILDSRVFNLNWNLVATAKGNVSITLVRRAFTWNEIPMTKVADTIMTAYRNDTDPFGVSCVDPVVHNCPIEGVGMQVQHRLLNFHGDLLTDYNLSMVEHVLRVGVDDYTLQVQAANGTWHDFHRFPLTKSIEVGTITSYQVWSTTGPNGVVVPHSGYLITKSVKADGKNRLKIRIAKVPSIAEVRGRRAEKARGIGQEVEFTLELDGTKRKLVNDSK